MWGDEFDFDPTPKVVPTKKHSSKKLIEVKEISVNFKNLINKSFNDMLLHSNSIFSPIMKMAINSGIAVEGKTKNKIIDIIINLIMKDFKDIQDNNQLNNINYQNDVEDLFNSIENKLKITKTILYDALNNKFL